MISYAQNCEDVVLARCFRHVKRGFYVDVGASDPVVHSVTKYFYDAGWSGINIEPEAGAFAMLQAQRHRDLNLNIGIASFNGTLDLFEGPVSMKGQSSFVESVASGLATDGAHFNPRRVEVRTLASVCEEWIDGEIDFLKIDTEGFEREVLAGADWMRWRPSVVVVEATAPNTATPVHQEWEHLLLAAEYRFALFDGLNRFYVRADRDDLWEMASVPANYFDHFVTHRERTLEEQLEACGDRIVQVQDALEQTRRQLQQARSERSDFERLARVSMEGVPTAGGAESRIAPARRRPPPN